MIPFIIGCAGVVKNSNEDKQPQFIGMWKEVKELGSIIHFQKGGTYKIYLKKGVLGDRRFIEGLWEMENNKMKVVIDPDGINVSDELSISFENDELVITDSIGKVIKHRRINGKIPEEYNW